MRTTSTRQVILKHELLNVTRESWMFYHSVRLSSLSHFSGFCDAVSGSLRRALQSRQALYQIKYFPGLGKRFWISSWREERLHIMCTLSAGAHVPWLLGGGQRITPVVSSFFPQ